jgi:hypothetical protein
MFDAFDDAFADRRAEMLVPITVMSVSPLIDDPKLPPRAKGPAVECWKRPMATAL